MLLNCNRTYFVTYDNSSQIHLHLLQTEIKLSYANEIKKIKLRQGYKKTGEVNMCRDLTKRDTRNDDLITIIISHINTTFITPKVFL